MLRAENDTTFRLSNELKQGVDNGDARKFVIDLFDGDFQEVALLIKNVKCSLHGDYLVLRVPRLPHACNINASNSVEFAGLNKWREVFGHDRIEAQVGKLPNAHELVHRRISIQLSVVFKDAMAGDQGALGQDTTIADLAIVA